jgi:phenylalanyl-tRNA synthetase alpha chain
MDELDAIHNRAAEALKAVRTSADINEFKTHYLGKQGQLTLALRHMGKLSADARPAVGKRANEIKTTLERTLADMESSISRSERDSKLMSAAIDVTMPGRAVAHGSVHPVTLVMDEVARIFARLGFQVATGPEVEEEFYNFDALNMPDTHPARDTQDTFFVKPGVVLRTHTSNMQIRSMLAQEPPLRLLAPGRVYRSDYDISHTPMFHQVEGFLVDEQVSFADLKGTLQYFAYSFFGPKAQLRFRPSFFPFVEPGAEVDVRCVFCEGGGCRACKESGWLEILGCGMIHPEVLGAVQYDTLKWSGFAFGMGVERMAMLKYGVPDLRLFFESDLRFIKQFRELQWKNWTKRLEDEAGGEK